MLRGIPELAPSADNGMTRDHAECTVVLSAVRPRSCSRSGGITGRPYPRRMVAATGRRAGEPRPGLSRGGLSSLGIPGRDIYGRIGATTICFL